MGLLGSLVRESRKNEAMAREADIRALSFAMRLAAQRGLWSVLVILEAGTQKETEGTAYVKDIDRSRNWLESQEEEADGGPGLRFTIDDAAVVGDGFLVSWQPVGERPDRGQP